MSDSLVAKRYGKAIFEVANEKGLLKEIENDLQLIVDTVENSTSLEEWMSHPTTLLEQKKAVLEKGFPDINQLTKNFLYVLIDERRENELRGIASEYRHLAFEASGLVEAMVTTAFPMSASEKAELVSIFSNIVGKKLIVKEQVDTDILGGVIVQVGDRLYDGSLRTKLRSFQERLNA